MTRKTLVRIKDNCIIHENLQGPNEQKFIKIMLKKGEYEWQYLPLEQRMKMPILALDKE